MTHRDRERSHAGNRVRRLCLISRTLISPGAFYHTSNRKFICRPWHSRKVARGRNVDIASASARFLFQTSRKLSCHVSIYATPRAFISRVVGCNWDTLFFYRFAHSRVYKYKNRIPIERNLFVYTDEIIIIFNNSFWNNNFLQVKIFSTTYVRKTYTVQLYYITMFPKARDKSL